jgi:predicted dehydrogenase
VDGAQLVAGCDLKPDAAKAAADRYGMPCYTDLHEMMAEHGDKIDAVSILTESGAHAEHTLELASYGKHIIVEKPMALTLEEADEMIQVCDANGIKLFVVKQNRYNYAVQALRKAFDAGRFGKIVMGTVRIRWCRDQSYYDQADWRGTWAMDGGVFANQASHHIDLLEWFLGPPVSVFAKSRTALVDIETEDTGVAIVTFASGAIGVIEATTATRPKDLEGSLSILGEKGSVEISGFAVNQIKTWQFDEECPDDARTLTESNEDPPNVYGFGHIDYMRHVVDAIREDGPSLVDGLEGRKSLRLISAIYESIETGKEISLASPFGSARLGRR